MPWAASSERASKATIPLNLAGDLTTVSTSTLRRRSMSNLLRMGHCAPTVMQTLLPSPTARVIRKSNPGNGSWADRVRHVRRRVTDTRASWNQRRVGPGDCGSPWPRGAWVPADSAVAIWIPTDAPAGESFAAGRSRHMGRLSRRAQDFAPSRHRILGRRSAGSSTGAASPGPRHGVGVDRP
jgi:hypothetical protein